MPAGCEFVCANDKCKYFKSGFTITAPWPMTDIDLVINSQALKGNQEHKKVLEEQKCNSKKYASIIMPNTENLPIKSYKLQLWSQEAKCIYEHYMSVENYNNSAKYENIPDKCPKTGCKLLDFNGVLEKGINCPMCGEKLVQYRFFTKD